MEIVIGWQHKDWKVALGALDLEVEYQDGTGKVLPQQEPTGDLGDDYDPPRIIEVKEGRQTTKVDRLFQRTHLATINRLLRRAHLAAVQEVGWMITQPQDDEWDSLSVVTPLGPRNLQPFALSVYYDPIERGDAVADALLCVPLSKRYRPCFLDWKNPNGTLEPVVLDEEMRRMMELARHHIVAVLSAFESATFMVSLEHY